MAASKQSLRKMLEAERDRLLHQRVKLQVAIDRSSDRQARLLTLLSEVPEVAAALRAGARPRNIDTETWTALQAFVAKG